MQETMKKTDAQKNAYINSLSEQEVMSAKSSIMEWPSLFSNIIEPRKKDLSVASAFYKTLTEEQIETRLAIHDWESSSYNIYDNLMGFSLTLLGRSIDPKFWAQKEILNIEELFKKGKNDLMTSSDFKKEYAGEIPSLYNKLIIGEWKNFISIDESRLFHEAISKYQRDNDFDSYNRVKNVDSYKEIDKVFFIKLMNQPREEQFLNPLYLATQEIQALIWYKEFLTEVISNGITFFDDEQKDPSKRKYINIKELRRTNNGFEAIKANFDVFVVKNDRIPKWTELMDYMARNPANGFIVDASYKGNLVSELYIEGVEKPIDRDAFRNRYNRYFKKMDIKADIK